MLHLSQQYFVHLIEKKNKKEIQLEQQQNED